MSRHSACFPFSRETLILAPYALTNWKEGLKIWPLAWTIPTAAHFNLLCFCVSFDRCIMPQWISIVKGFRDQFPISLESRSYPSCISVGKKIAPEITRSLLLCRSTTNYLARLRETLLLETHPRPFRLVQATAPFFHLQRFVYRRMPFLFLHTGLSNYVPNLHSSV